MGRFGQYYALSPSLETSCLMTARLVRVQPAERQWLLRLRVADSYDCASLAAGAVTFRELRSDPGSVIVVVESWTGGDETRGDLQAKE
jgi:hypothetical protein